MSNSIYIKLIIITTLFVLHSCKDSRINKTPNKLSTQITVNFKKDSDKSFIIFQQYDSFPLRDYTIIDPPANKQEHDTLKTIIRFNISHPAHILLGFNELYILPGANLVINYEVKTDSKTQFIDYMQVASGSGAVLQNGEMHSVLNNRFIESIRNAKNEKKINAILNIERISKEADNHLQKLNLKYIPAKDAENIQQHVKLFYLKNYYIQLLLQLKKSLPTMDNKNKEYTIEKVYKLSENLNRVSLQEQDYKYWVCMKIFYEQILNEEFLKNNFDLKYIDSKIKNFDPLTKEYFLLFSAKGMIMSNQKDNHNFNNIVSRIKYPLFKSFISKASINQTGSKDEMNEIVKSLTLYNYNMKPVALENLFKQASQDYLFFDFCGTWCRPCIEEIAEYAKNKKFDNSNKLKPFWIFFENNESDWLKIIEKYHLKKENCFLIKGEDANTIKREFSINFGWKGEFPHHFIFHKNFKLVDREAHY